MRGNDVHERAAGVLVASACGDALGAAYEFRPPEAIPAEIGMVGGGPFQWQPGEWTDDTAMSWVIAQVARSGMDLRSAESQDRIVTGWIDWMRQAKDVGNQTRSVLATAAAKGGAPAEAARSAAAQYHAEAGRSGGNGSLMRTAPVALAYLDEPDALTDAAMQISALTHFDPEAGEACVLQCHAIRRAVLDSVLDFRAGLPYLQDSPRHDQWRTRLESVDTTTPEEFSNNYWVVEALLGAWSAIVGTQHTGQDHVPHALEAAVRGGRDTDTVACIAGALVGGAYGVDAVPDAWSSRVHGWPGKDIDDLRDAALQIIAAG